MSYYHPVVENGRSNVRSRDPGKASASPTRGTLDDEEVAVATYDVWVDFMTTRNDGPAKATVMNVDISGAIILQMLDVAGRCAASA
jgi:hypothetical protein